MTEKEVNHTSLTIVLINLFAANKSSGFLLCNNFCKSFDFSSSSNIGCLDFEDLLESSEAVESADISSC